MLSSPPLKPRVSGGSESVPAAPTPSSTLSKSDTAKSLPADTSALVLTGLFALPGLLLLSPGLALLGAGTGFFASQTFLKGSSR
jgi:hypothetical protein